MLYIINFSIDGNDFTRKRPQPKSTHPNEYYCNNSPKVIYNYLIAITIVETNEHM